MNFFLNQKAISANFGCRNPKKTQKSHPDSWYKGKLKWSNQVIWELFRQSYHSRLNKNAVPLILFEQLFLGSLYTYLILFEYTNDAQYSLRVIKLPIWCILKEFFDSLKF